MAPPCDSLAHLRVLGGSQDFRKPRRTRTVTKETNTASRELKLATPGLRRENFRFRNVRRFGKEVFRFRKKCLGDVTVEVSVAAIFVSEGIKDAVCGRTHLDSVPTESARFALGQRLRRFQKVFDFLLFARFRFQLRPNS